MALIERRLWFTPDEEVMGRKGAYICVTTEEAACEEDSVEREEMERVADELRKWIDGDMTSGIPLGLGEVAGFGVEDREKWGLTSREGGE